MSALFLHFIFALGGGFGAGVRHLLTKRITHRFPFSTLVINVLGCFLLALGTGLLTPETTLIGADAHDLVFGFCGGFTTFSSFAYQTLDLHRKESILHAALNIAMSLVLCLFSYGFGLWITGW